MLLIGCIADDFTGAADAASYLAKGGLTVQLFSGVPGRVDKPEEGVSAVVIALKSRMQETPEAVRDVLRAAFWLKRKGTEHFYFKYCATFDSTEDGNIGPCADALCNFLNVPFSVLCPAAPANGRTVAGGCIYLNNVLLHESHMKDHPLTPMRRSRIADLMKPQSIYPVVEWSWGELYAGPNRIRKCLSLLQEKIVQKEKKRFYIVPDCLTEIDSEQIVKIFGELKLLTGGSGLLFSLAKKYSGQEPGSWPKPATDGRAVVLSGSCSAPTLRQIDYFLKAGYQGMKMDAEQLLDGRQTTADFCAFLNAHDDAAMVYSSEDTTNVRSDCGLDRETVSSCLEETTAQVAAWALDSGYTRLIVAGGETSGAVIQKLGYRSFLIGESVAPGVPVLVPVEDDRIRIVLKSGGFGQDDFFVRAIQMTGTDV